MRDSSRRTTKFWKTLCCTVGFTKKEYHTNSNSYVGSTRHIPKKFLSAALSTATQPWWSTALPTRRHDSQRSWDLEDLKRTIFSKHHVLSIKPLRSPRTHHGEAPELIFDFFTLAKKAPNRKLQPHAADAKEVHWVAGADAPNGFPRLK
jgi:hypothetical protein